MKKTTKIKASESGNVLFLILIAVALFAALSYVVTQSTRSGGGSTEREQNLLSSASMTQYPTALRTALVRMILGGAAVEDIAFNEPGNFGTVSTNNLVFHPQGGGAVYQEAPANLMATNDAGAWLYSASFDVPGIGIDGAGGNDVIAFLPEISAGICRQANEELGLDIAACTAGALVSGVPDTGIALSAITATSAQMDDDYTFPTTNQTDIVSTTTGCTTVFDRQASGCFATSDDKFVFYSVLLER
jgi:hypothetical protein